jgi:hypothetical protein
MKITKEFLKQLIKEETKKILNEVKCPAGCVPAPKKPAKAAPPKQSKSARLKKFHAPTMQEYIKRGYKSMPALPTGLKAGDKFKAVHIGYEVRFKTPIGEVVVLVEAGIRGRSETEWWVEAHELKPGWIGTKDRTFGEIFAVLWKKQP